MVVGSRRTQDYNIVNSGAIHSANLIDFSSFVFQIATKYIEPSTKINNTTCLDYLKIVYLSFVLDIEVTLFSQHYNI